MRKIPAELCVKCKGYKYLCGLPSCPILDRFRNIAITVSKIKSSNKIQGATPPSIVVGERNYPKVSLVYNVPPSVIGEEAKDYENPENWWGKKSLSDILSLRTSMISSLLSGINVNNPEVLYEKEVSITAVAEKPVLSEVYSENKEIIPKLKFDGILLPRGPSLKAKDIKIDENPKVPKPIEKLITDDVKAQQAILELYNNKQSVYTIINALSLGLLGKRKNRKIVPTRWAITAVDTTLGNFMLNEIKGLDTISETLVYYNSYLGNYFHIILFPSKYRSIWIEIWHPLSLWANELVVSDLSEDYWGEYDFLDGGYMAARMSVIEKLYEMRRQAGIIIIREITSEYYAPVGNWHIRETVKRAFNNSSVKFDKLEDAIKYVNSRLRAKINLFEIKSIKSLITQRTIDEFLKK
ncbi:Nre family DNA repair protein [Sulfurisphaera ohwakuensis]|uniref:Nre family DNA repair protein n=1 Tax=Sulfurisphaera ohwakuensis TaxID=69656 RepID=UPI0036F3DD82